MTTYRIRDWTDHFETCESRKLKGPLKWVAIKTKHDGKTYRQLMKHPRAAAVYGAWVLIVTVAGKCPVHGVLADEDGPLTADDLANKTGLSAEHFAEAFEVLSVSPFRWLESVDSTGNPPESAGIPADPLESQPTQQDRTQQDITRQNKEPPNPLAGGTGSPDGSPKGSASKTAKRPARTSTTKREPFDPSLVPISAELRTPAFLDAWRDWIAARFEKRKPLTKRAAEEQLRQLAEVGPDAAVKAIRKSIANDWQGVFPEAVQRNGKSAPMSGISAWLEGSGGHDAT